MWSWNDPETALLMLANLALGLGVLACVIRVGIAILLGIVSRLRVGWRIGNLIVYQARGEEVLAGKEAG